MAFFINDKLGVAFEDVKDVGDIAWCSEDKDFTRSLTAKEIKERWWDGARRVSEDEARALMLAKDASSEAEASPRG